MSSCGCTHGVKVPEFVAHTQGPPLLVSSVIARLKEIESLNTLEDALTHFSFEEKYLYPLSEDQVLVQQLVAEHSIMLADLLKGRSIDAQMLKRHEAAETRMINDIIQRFK